MQALAYEYRLSALRLIVDGSKESGSDNSSGLRANLTTKGTNKVSRATCMPKHHCFRAPWVASIYQESQASKPKVYIHQLGLLELLSL
jgi:hypothetical protein